MDLSLRTETWGQDDASWLGSSHGTSSGRSITLDASAFTAADHYPEGYFPSGLPLTQLESGLYGPYTVAGEEEPPTVLAGFLLDAVTAPATDGDNVVGALLDHGRVRVDRLPVDGFAAPAPEADATTIVFA